MAQQGQFPLFCSQDQRVVGFTPSAVTMPPTMAPTMPPTCTYNSLMSPVQLTLNMGGMINAHSSPSYQPFLADVYSQPGMMWFQRPVEVMLNRFVMPQCHGESSQIMQGTPLQAERGEKRRTLDEPQPLVNGAKRAKYTDEFKTKIVREALLRPENARIKPTCSKYPHVEPCQLRKWIQKFAPSQREGAPTSDDSAQPIPEITPTREPEFATPMDTPERDNSLERDHVSCASKPLNE